MAESATLPMWTPEMTDVPPPPWYKAQEAEPPVVPVKNDAPPAQNLPVWTPEMTDVPPPPWYKAPKNEGEYGLRNDGTKKGSGYWGPLKGRGQYEGQTMSEYTIGVDFDGKETEIPTLVPTLTQEELDQVLRGNVSDTVVNKAVEHAKSRMAEGKSVFADEPNPVSDKDIQREREDTADKMFGIKRPKDWKFSAEENAVARTIINEGGSQRDADEAVLVNRLHDASPKLDETLVEKALQSGADIEVGTLFVGRDNRVYLVDQGPYKYTMTAPASEMPNYREMYSENPKFAKDAIQEWLDEHSEYRRTKVVREVQPEEQAKIAFAMNDSMRAKESIDESWFPKTKSVALATGLSTLSLFERVLGQEQSADESNRLADAFREASTKYDKESVLPEWMSRAVRGVGESLPKMVAAGGVAGPYGAIGMASAEEANQAITAGRDVGLSGGDLLKYVLREGVAEAMPATLFQVTGFGGVERLFGKHGTEFTGGIKEALRAVGVTAIQELPEENITELWHNLNKASYKINPNALSGEAIRQTVFDTTVQTLMTVGAMHSPQIAIAATEVTKQRLGQLKKMRSKGWITMEEGKELGLPEETLKNRETRKAAVDERIQQTEQEIQDAERTARQAEEAGPQEGPEGEAGGPIRVRDVEQSKEGRAEEGVEQAAPVQEAPAEKGTPETPPEAPRPEQAPEPVSTPETQPQAAREPESPNYADMTVKELTSRARDLGLKGYSGKKKATLVGMLEEYGKQAEEQPAAPVETARPAAQKGVRGGPGSTVPTSPGQRGGKTQSTGDVVSSLSTAFGVPIRTGHFRADRQTKGIYKDMEEVVRIKGYGDIAVASHEVAHHIDKTMDPLATIPSDMQDELAALDYKPKRGDIHEGFAEYVRHRLTGDDAAISAPKFDGWFTKWLDANPAMAEAFKTGKAAIDQWRGAGAVERVKAQIHMGESKWKQVGRALRPKTAWDWIANNWINRLRPLLNVAKEMTGTGSTADLLSDMPIDLNFWAFAKISNMNAASKARGWAKGGTRTAGGKKVGPGLKETFAPIANELQDTDALLDFYAYAYSRHASTLYDQYNSALAEWRMKGEVGPAPSLKQPGISHADALATIDEFDSKPGWRKAAEGLTSWHNDLIDYLADAGGLSEEAATTMKEMYPNYISLARHMDSEFAPAAGGGGGRYANLPRGVRRLKGSGRQILPPLESALAYAERIIGLADKIRVSKMLVEASKKYNTLGDTVEKVDPKDVAMSTRLRSLERQLNDAGADLSNADMDALLTVFSQEFTGDAKDNILVIYENGKPQLYYVRQDLYRALMAVDKPARLPAVIDKTFGRVARAIRLGTTGLKPGFSLLTNPLRDIQTALFQTEYQPRNPFSIALNAAQGLVEDITGSEVAQLWESGGGPMAQPLGIDRKFLKETVQELLAQSPKAKIINWMSHPVDSLRSLFSISEAAPRIAEFRAALYEMGWRPGKEVTFEQYVKAQLAAANVTVDFSEGGALAMWVNQIIPFFNATIQGPHRMASSIRNHPVASISSAVLWLTVPTLALWYKQKDEEWYKNLTPMERYRYWHIRIPGTDTTLRIPKPFEWGHIFASMPEGAAQSIVDKDPEAISESAGTMLEDLTPSVLPGLLEAPIEISANKDFFFDRPLIPERLKRLDTKDQYNPYTTETAKAIGGLLGVSPIYVEHLAGGWTGGLATQAAGAVESIAGVVSKKTQRSITGGPSTLPVVGRLFLSNLHNRQFDDFYTRLEKLEQKHASLKLRGKSDPSITMLKFMQDRSKDLAEIRNESRTILADDSLTDDQKRDRFLENHLKMAQMATEANQMAHLNRPSTGDDLQKKWKEIHKEMSAGVIYNASKAPPNPDKYKGRQEQLRKAQEKYRETRELEKNRALAVASTHEEAQQLLAEYYRRPGRKDANEYAGKTGELQKGYMDRGIALAKLYGEAEPRKAFITWYRKWVKTHRPPRQVSRSSKR
jgi:hypothetical protein